MGEYTVEIELLSETIFGNGEASNIDIDIDIVKDKYGIPYFKGKNLKGKLRKEVQGICDLLGLNEKLVNELFGGEFNDISKLRFSDCTLSKKIINNLITLIESTGCKSRYAKITKDDITKSLTNIRYFTRIGENGVAESGSLRSARVIKKGLKFYSDIHVNGELLKEEEEVLACGIAALRNIGSMESRGKGNVRCKLLKTVDGAKYDITKSSIEDLERKCSNA